MAVRIRLTRTGRRNCPSYKVAVFDSKTRRDGRYIENLGSYDPKKKDPSQKVIIKTDRLKHWISNGARMTPSVEALLKHVKISAV